MAASREQVDQDLNSYLGSIDYQQLAKSLAEKLRSVNIEPKYPDAKPKTKEDLANFKQKLRAAGIETPPVLPLSAEREQYLKDGLI